MAVDISVVASRIEELGIVLSVTDTILISNLCATTERDLLNKCNLEVFTKTQLDNVVDIVISRFLASRDSYATLDSPSAIDVKAVTVGDTKIEMKSNDSNNLIAYAEKQANSLEKAFIRRNRVLAW